MIRTLLATTAIASVLATAALAQTAPATAPATATEPAANSGAMGTMQPGGTAGGAMSNGATADAAPTADIAYVQMQGDDQYMATDIRGATLYSTAAADAESAGQIQNLVIGEDGSVVAAVVDTGSFLGDQSRTIAIPFDQINWTRGEDNAPRAVLTASRDQLMNAPAFAMTDTAANNAAATGGAMAPAATGGTAPAGTMAPGGAMGSTAATGAMTPATTPSTDMAAATTAPMATTGSTMGSGEYLATLGSNQYLSANLIGEDVYNGHDTSSEDIGEINDLLIASSGQVEAVVIGVGGFLGIGEKNVGVPFDNVSMMRDAADAEPHLMLAATRDQLTNAPAFEENTEVADTSAAPATGTSAGGTTLDTASAVGGTTAATGAAATGAMGTAATGAMGTAAMGTDTTATASTGNAAGAGEAMTPVTGAELTADNLIGTAVQGPDNARIGSIGDIALTPEGQVDAVIVDVGGFLGIGAKPVAVAMDNLQFMRDSGGRLALTTQFTQDQLRNAPEFNRDTYAQNRDTMRVANPGDIPAGSASAQ